MNTAPFFDAYYKKAAVNSILIMDADGKIVDINEAFTANFGYTPQDLQGKYLGVLYTAEDNEKDVPGQELKKALTTGQATDENFIVNKEGHPIWCTGESILIDAGKEGRYIVKDVVNLQARKQLQLFLSGTEDLLERVFTSSKDIPMMILDGSMKVQKMNTAFLRLFEMPEAPAEGSRLADLPHPFWEAPEIKEEIRKTLVTHEPIRQKDFPLTTKTGELKTIRVDSKIVERQSGPGRQLFLIFDER